MDCRPPGSSVHRIFQTRVLEWLNHVLLKGVFPTQGSNPHQLCLLNCRPSLFYPLRHQGFLHSDIGNRDGFAIFVRITVFLAVLGVFVFAEWRPLADRASQAPHCSGLSCCWARAVGAWASVVTACRLSGTGSAVAGLDFVAPRPVGSSQLRDQARVSRIGRQILYH